MATGNESEIIELLKRNNELLTVLAKAQLRAALDSELEDPINKKLYSLTGKQIPVRQIAGQIKSSPATISRTWQRWERIGLIIKKGKYYRKVFP